MVWDLGISRCKLLYLEWINNKVLLYSTGNYIQYPVINHNAGTFLVVQWLRLSLPMQGAQVQSLEQDGTISHMHAETKSLHATTKEPACCN